MDFLTKAKAQATAQLEAAQAAASSAAAKAQAQAEDLQKRASETAKRTAEAAEKAKSAVKAEAEAMVSEASALRKDALGNGAGADAVDPEFEAGTPDVAGMERSELERLVGRTPSATGTTSCPVSYSCFGSVPTRHQRPPLLPVRVRSPLCLRQSSLACRRSSSRRSSARGWR